MVIFKRVADLKEFIYKQRQEGRNIGFVPTMGALHQGHLSLVKRAKDEGTLVVCSIFVNPTQFNDKSDFEKYPISVDTDIELLTGAGCDVLLLPGVNDVYPNGPEAMKTYDFGYLDTILEGAKRPGHFKGVGQVVARLLEIVEPNKLYLGQKDYQQCKVITKLAELTEQKDLDIVICATTREADGLAMSSRNRRLTEPQRTVAGLIYQCLVSIESKQDNTSYAIVRKECEDILTAKGFAVEYVALANAGNLELLDEYKKGTPMVALIAAKIGEIRLIDNLVLG